MKASYASSLTIKSGEPAVARAQQSPPAGSALKATLSNAASKDMGQHPDIRESNLIHSKKIFSHSKSPRL